MVSLTSLLLAQGTIQASKGLFKKMLECVLRNPMSFFDSTPSGRILNRLGKDVDVVDNQIPFNLRSWMTCFFGV